MKADASHCLATPASKARCKVDCERRTLMSSDCAGRSLLELMEDSLDEIVWQLALAGAHPDTPDAATVLLRGRARGVAECIALVRTPYAPDVDAVRAAASTRYQARLALVTAS